MMNNVATWCTSEESFNLLILSKAAFDYDCGGLLSSFDDSFNSEKILGTKRKKE